MLAARIDLLYKQCNIVWCPSLVIDSVPCALAIVLVSDEQILQIQYAIYWPYGLCNNRSDLCGGTTSKTHRVLSLLLTAMTEIALLRQGMSCTGC